MEVSSSFTPLIPTRLISASSSHLFFVQTRSGLEFVARNVSRLSSARLAAAPRPPGRRGAHSQNKYSHVFIISIAGRFTRPLCVASDPADPARTTAVYGRVGRRRRVTVGHRRVTAGSRPTRRPHPAGALTALLPHSWRVCDGRGRRDTHELGLIDAARPARPIFPARCIAVIYHGHSRVMHMKTR